MILSRFLVLPLLFVLFVACSSDDATNPTDGKQPTSSQTYVRCTVSGPDLEPTTFTADVKNNVHSIGYYYDESENYSVFNFINFDMVMNGAFPGRSTGTFSFGEQYFITLQLNVDTGSQLHLVSESGTLVIQEAIPSDRQVKGTFSGSFSSGNGSVYTVTNGEFFLKKK
jgi:hypothetical protein